MTAPGMPLEEIDDVLPTAHVVVIGRHTLPAVLFLLKRGFAAVRCLRPGAPAPDCERADLAWIVDYEDERELEEALHAARARVGAAGRIVVDGRLNGANENVTPATSGRRE
jgi:hypothetical protein